ncbi:MAG: TlpA family protein disulfide reductase [Gemmatimonadetes bacterium]|uniref:TlpA family protein disulfide reductase n=1 Tax=Candidatus Kutchimonas denitrificans TaxID=3056748 RepID=A0AAE4ZAQ3_9BACT|nr:TlpA family protein disulfide reductase [Gemmatimonadota bacterium]NIR74651.1 TlpA family protein disulfide reductase [Candidatus Kutchimonas denitrificans]NIS02841.1 TlpA family protein disulfide reductase [Gemmatimonadota bacterium]NIT69002.1 TlpA family protein disulfide reductase [Gemmatimonadota bacterium]NIU52307.1 redoxin domain-containing protein [Gemmatimonadota bacterium]
MTKLSLSVALAILVAGLGGCEDGEERLPEGPPPTYPPIVDSRLTFVPGRLGDDAIEVTYRPIEELAGAAELRLRARFRTANDGYATFDGRADYLTAAILRSSEGGHFRAQMEVPDSIAYAIFAVEDTTGSTIDANGGRFWELLRHDVDGRPTFDALLQATNEHLVSDADRVAEIAHVMIEAYPDRFGSWVVHDMAERRIRPTDQQGELQSSRRSRAKRFHRRFEDEEHVPADEMAHLYWYGYVLEDAGIEEFWHDRLLDEHPGSGFAIEFRLRDLPKELEKDTTAYLRELERSWQTAQPGPGVSARWGWDARSVLVQRALPAAARTRRAETAALWAERYRAHARVADPDGSAGLWIRRVPELRQRGMTLIRGAIARLDSVNDRWRPPGRTVAAQRRENRRESVWYLRWLGQELLDAGEVSAAIDTFRVAAGRVWYPYLRDALANAYLAAGDTARALEAWAFVAAYGPRPMLEDSVRARTGSHFDEERWSSLIEDAKRDLRRSLLAESVSRSIPGGIRLTGRDGATRTLDDIRDGRPAVVFFWSRYCEPSVRALRDVKRLARRLEGYGATLLAVTADSSSADFDAFLSEQDVEFRVWHDERRDAVRAFRSVGTPEFFVLDRTGAVRFEMSHTADDARFQLEALIWEARREAS